jgi:diguanylate cyclase (GGDEF)-like protein
VRDAQGAVRRFVAMFSDITAQKVHQRELEKLAHYDALTGLPNRSLLADRLQQSMLRAIRQGSWLAIAYLDLDGFKAVNDRYGHDMGDRLLTVLAMRMKHVLREGDTLARIGGDEFVAVLGDLPDIERCEPLLARLLEAAAEEITIDDTSMRVSASLGVTFYPQAEAIDPDQLLRQADQAMYQAKLLGKNRYHLFDTDQDRALRGRHEDLDRIRRALERDEFVLYYQPKVNMRTGCVLGVEALIRWQHPERGLLAPAEFLPLIETHPLAVDVGNWVLDSALAQLAQWHAEGLALQVGVNVGARELQQADFIDRLRARLERYPALPTGRLELEVLESSALDDIGQVSQVMEACRNLGVLFALDDFGTGYSSLTYLRRLPAATLKIDRSFVRDMLHDPEDRAILEGILGLAAAFRRRVVAEGVETVDHGELLLDLGCELAQGYGIARPMPAAQLPDWIRRWAPPPAWLNRPRTTHDEASHPHDIGAHYVV